MKIKPPEDIIKGLKIKYCSSEDNVYYLEKLFVAASVVKWIFSNTKDTNEILQYLSQVERHMTGQINLYWDNGIIKVGSIKRGKE